MARTVIEISYKKMFDNHDGQVEFVDPMICTYNDVKIYVIGAEIMDGIFCINYYEEEDWHDGNVDATDLKWIEWSEGAN